MASELLLEATLREAQAKDERLDLVLPKLQRMVLEETVKLDKARLLLAQLEQKPQRSPPPPPPHGEHSSEEDEDEEEEGYTDHEDEEDDDDDSSLLAQLQQLQQEKLSLQARLDREAEQRRAAATTADAVLTQQLAHDVETSAVISRTIENERKLHVLTSTSALSELFRISSGGSGEEGGMYGTINGLKLGWIPDLGREVIDVVVIEEVNAAWGFAALMLDTLAQSMDFRFFVWRVHANGSMSEMVNVRTDSQRLSLYLTASSTHLISSWWLWNTTFNAGVKAFASCVDEFAEYLRLSDPSVVLPHRIDKSTIGGLPLHFALNSGEQWTRAMKYLLTNLKWLEIFCIRAARGSRRPRQQQ